MSKRLSISKAWEETRGIIARDGKLLATIALALFVLPGVIAELVTPAAPPGKFPAPGYWTIAALLALLISLAGQLAVIRIGMGSRVAVGEAIGDGVRRAPSFFAANLLWALPFALTGAVLLGVIGRNREQISAPLVIVLLLLVCLMLFVAVRMMLTGAVASAESTNPLAIVRRSWDLTRGHWLRLFGFFLVFVAAALIVLTVVQALVGIVAQLALGGIEPMTVGALLQAFFTQMASAAVTVVLVLMIARIYVQLAGAGAAEASVPATGG